MRELAAKDDRGAGVDGRCHAQGVTSAVVQRQGGVHPIAGFQLQVLRN